MSYIDNKFVDILFTPINARTYTLSNVQIKLTLDKTLELLYNIYKMRRATAMQANAAKHCDTLIKQAERRANATKRNEAH